MELTNAIIETETETETESETDVYYTSSSYSSDTEVSEQVSETSSEFYIFTFEDLTSEDIAEIIDDAYDLIDECFCNNLIKLSNPSFYSDVCKHVADTLYLEWELADLCNDDEEYDELIELVEGVMETYSMYCGLPQRSIPYTVNTIQPMMSDDIDDLTQQITRLQAIPQPEQRTPEWYQFRNGLITASNLWKVFGSQSQINSLIYEKCKSIEAGPGETRHFNINSPMHWGVKYEPVTVMLYEMMYQTKIGEFGCIQHPDISCVGASPDGINIDPTSDRFGRMLEIKNIVNREITGIPKEEYWIQTQIQMETCNLDKCDFVETRMKEYSCEQEFYTDTASEHKGIILHFIKRDMDTNIEPIYVYMPLSVEIEHNKIHEWIAGAREEAYKTNLVLFTTIYWYVDEFSCVLVERNRKWFEKAAPKIQNVWNIITSERVDGYEHRAAKKRVPKTPTPTTDISGAHVIQNIQETKKICLVKLDF